MGKYVTLSLKINCARDDYWKLAGRMVSGNQLAYYSSSIGYMKIPDYMTLPYQESSIRGVISGIAREFLMEELLQSNEIAINFTDSSYDHRFVEGLELRNKTKNPISLYITTTAQIDTGMTVQGSRYEFLIWRFKSRALRNYALLTDPALAEHAIVKA